jgi:hypothetical protein
MVILPTQIAVSWPLFSGNNPNIKLILDTYSIDEGVVVLHYSKESKKT